MKSKVIIACILVFILGVVVIIRTKNDSNNNTSQISSVNSDNLPIKVEDIDYKVESFKNNKGQVLIYLKAVNNSSTAINHLSVDISNDKNLDTTIEYLGKIEPKCKTDNYDDIKNSKDDRTKLPIKDKNGRYIYNLDQFKINSISYSYNDNGVEKIVKYDTHTNKYTISKY